MNVRAGLKNKPMDNKTKAVEEQKPVEKAGKGRKRRLRHPDRWIVGGIVACSALAFTLWVVKENRVSPDYSWETRTHGDYTYASPQTEGYEYEDAEDYSDTQTAVSASSQAGDPEDTSDGTAYKEVTVKEPASPVTIVKEAVSRNTQPAMTVIRTETQAAPAQTQTVQQPVRPVIVQSTPSEGKTVYIIRYEKDDSLTKEEIENLIRKYSGKMEVKIIDDRNVKKTESTESRKEAPSEATEAPVHSDKEETTENFQNAEVSIACDLESGKLSLSTVNASTLDISKVAWLVNGASIGEGLQPDVRTGNSADIQAEVTFKDGTVAASNRLFIRTNAEGRRVSISDAYLGMLGQYDLDPETEAELSAMQ